MEKEKIENQEKKYFTTITIPLASGEKLSKINWTPKIYQHPQSNPNSYIFSVLIGNREIIRFTAIDPNNHVIDWSSKAKMNHSFDCILDFIKYTQRIINKGWQYLDYKNYGYYIIQEQNSKNPQWQHLYKQLIMHGKRNFNDIFKDYILKVSLTNNFENNFPNINIFKPSIKKTYSDA